MNTCARARARGGAGLIQLARPTNVRHFLCAADVNFTNGLLLQAASGVNLDTTSRLRESSFTSFSYYFVRTVAIKTKVALSIFNVRNVKEKS